jgi:hypothetical protein
MMDIQTLNTSSCGTKVSVHSPATPSKGGRVPQSDNGVGNVVGNVVVNVVYEYQMTRRVEHTSQLQKSKRNEVEDTKSTNVVNHSGSDEEDRQRKWAIVFPDSPH